MQPRERGPNEREAVARAIAFFQSTDDGRLLRRLLVEIAPRARRRIERYMQRGGEGSVPQPADVPPATVTADEAEAVRTLEAATDFALLQAMARAIGRRVEELHAEQD